MSKNSQHAVQEIISECIPNPSLILPTCFVLSYCAQSPKNNYLHPPHTVSFPLSSSFIGEVSSFEVEGVKSIELKVLAWWFFF
jgi:hypothetical protein